MLVHRLKHTGQKGFTIAELAIVMLLISLIMVFAYPSFNNAINQYFGLQRDADAFYDLANHYQRIGNVLRGLTDITSASANDMVLYAYFYPRDSSVSLIHYYINQGNLVADVTPMTANPPTGTPITAQKRTYTIINNFHSVVGTDTFVYLDDAGSVLPLPINNLHTIKGIRVNLAVSSVAPNTNSQALTLQVSLRNRKTNL